MKRKPVVFSLVKNQSIFMTTIMALLTFLSVLALGIALAIGTGVMRWNSQWNLYATVQISEEKNAPSVEKILNDNRDKIDTQKKISTQEMQDLMRPWISGGGGAMKNYLPQMYEIKFKTESDLRTVGEKISEQARFLTHSDALKTSTSAGWKMISICALVLVLVLASIGVCISFIARNTAMLHSRELEILNQIGATDAFVARQMQIIVAKISAFAAAIGFVVAVPFLWLILSAAHSARVGMLATLGLTTFGWWLLVLLPILIVLFAVMMTRRTTLNILKNS